MRGIVYYYQKDLGQFYFNNIIKDYEKLKIDITTKKDNLVVFANGDDWKLVKINEGIRGHSCNVAYIPSNVLETDLKLIKKTIKCNPYQGFHFYQGA